MKDSNGFHVDVVQAPVPQDMTTIRMNVDNMDEAIEMLTTHGFRKAQLFNDTVDTPTSRFNIMISPSGFIFDVIQHKK